MNVNVEKPELQRFVEEQVRSGRFGSAADVVAAALTRYRDGAEADEDLDDETAADLRASFTEAERGRTMTVEEAAARIGVALTRERGQSGAA